MFIWKKSPLLPKAVAQIFLALPKGWYRNTRALRICFPFMVVMSYPYVLVKCSLVRKLPSYGRMSRSSLVITSATEAEQFARVAESNSSEHIEHALVSGWTEKDNERQWWCRRLFLLWKISRRNQTNKYEKPPLTYALKQFSTRKHRKEYETVWVHDNIE